jgi:hypothetical protein
MSEIKEIQPLDTNNEANAKKRYSAYMKKLNELAKKNEKKQNGEEK